MLTIKLLSLLVYDVLSSVPGGEDGRPPAVVSADTSRRRMPGPIMNSTAFSKQKNPITNDSVVAKDVMVSHLECVCMSFWF